MRRPGTGDAPADGEAGASMGKEEETVMVAVGLLVTAAAGVSAPCRAPATEVRSSRTEYLRSIRPNTATIEPGNGGSGAVFDG
jgi:hypothetical protein